MCICMYECENINAVHQAQTKYAVRKLLQRETYTAGAEFFSSPWIFWFFFVYTFLIFIARGGVVDGVCVCVVLRLQKVAKIATLCARNVHTFCLPVAAYAPPPTSL